MKLNHAFPGKVVRKDLLHDIKRAVNVPSFVLEFLLSRYCASEDPEEIEEGKKAVLQTIEKCYVRPDESNKAQAIIGTTILLDIDFTPLSSVNTNKNATVIKLICLNDTFVRSENIIINISIV